MTSIRSRAGLLVLGAVAMFCTFAAAPAAAQTATNIAPPPEQFAQSPGGVDMRSGRYMYSQTDLAIPAAGFALTRTMTQQVAGHNSPFANFSHNWDMMVSEKRINITTGIFTNTPGQPDYQIEFAFGGRSQSFRAYSNATFDQTSRGGYAKISPSAGNVDRSSAAIVYTLQTGDGTTAVFRPLGSADCSSGMRCAYVSQITNADGTSYSFEYDATGGANTSRLRSVTSNHGYALLFEYSGSLITKACVVNLTATTKPSNNLCPAGVPTATYTYDTLGGETRMASATDPSGAVWSFVNTGTTIGFKKPGQAVPWLTNSFTSRLNDDAIPEQIVNSQSFAEGQSYTYNWDHAPAMEGHVPQIAGGNFSDAQFNMVTVQYDFPVVPGNQGDQQLIVPCGCPQDTGGRVASYQITPGPIAVTDALGRTTTTDYCDPSAAAAFAALGEPNCLVSPIPVSTTDPGGFKTDLAWDIQMRNLQQTHRYAKAGTGLQDVVASAQYDCSGPEKFRFCNKPVRVIDANGNTTVYAYAIEHGGVLTETLPAPAAGAPQPQKRFTYAQRYAWISNGAGGYVQAATPVWVLTQMSVCKEHPASSSGVGCSFTGDEVITSYDYGPDSGPNNLFLRGTVVDAGGLSLRSCMAYDALGNKISETRPRAGLTSCP